VNEEVLAGGIANPNAVVRVGDTVRRPTSEYARSIHAFLNHLSEAGFEASRPLELHESHEVLTFVPGDVPIPPYPTWALTDDALASIATLLRSFHDAADPFDGNEMEWADELRDPRGAGIVCHNDVCLENVVFRDGRAVAFLDFDYAAPGRRIWDVAMMARMCVPMRPPDDPLPGQDVLDPFARFRIVADAYGIEPSEHAEFVDALIETKRAGLAFVRRHVEAGEPGFTAMWDEREAAFHRQLEWLIENREEMVAALA
jgi:Ser/Thr protein kinase RdoA (MazF antagonist)